MTTPAPHLHRIYEKDSKLIEPNSDGCVYKLWYTDTQGQARYAESPDKLVWTVAWLEGTGSKP